MSGRGLSCLVGAGATTAVGGTLAVSAAALRAGLTRTVRRHHGPAGEEDAWSHVVVVRGLEQPGPEERAAALAGAALAQAYRPLEPLTRGRRVGAFWAGPPSLASWLGAQLGVPAGSVSSAGAHASASLYALRDACEALVHGRLDVAVVVGAEVRSDPATVASELADGRVLGGESSFGTVPGEAGGALVLVAEPLREALGLASLGRLLAVASADEPVPHGGATPCLGHGLTEAIGAALAPLGGARRVAHVLCDLNGERQRTDEWGVTVPRLHRELEVPNAFISPLSAFGDVGAPTGLLLVALASRSLRAATPTPCLVWTSSRGRERAAALFEVAPSPAPTAAPSAHVPGWAVQLDGSVLDELAEECTFRDEQREHVRSRAASEAPEAACAALGRVEVALERLVAGLVECGPQGWASAEGTLLRPSPGALYTAARVLFGAGQHGRASAVIRQHAGASAQHAGAARRAIVQGRPSGPEIEALVGEWLAAGPPLQTLAVELAAGAAVRVPTAALLHASDALPQDDERASADWIAALCRLGQADALLCVGRWLSSPSPLLRRCCAAAELALGGADGRARVLARSEQDPAVVLPAAIAVGPERAHVLRDLASKLSGADACLALGQLGDPGAVPHLLERLGEADTASAAACALEILLGAAPLGTRLELDLDETAPPREVSCVSLDAAAWRLLAEGVLGRVPPGARVRAGGVAGVAATATLLGRQHLPLCVRRHLALELRVRWRAEPVLDPEALLGEQRRAAVELAAWAERTTHGAWG